MKRVILATFTVFIIVGIVYFTKGKIFEKDCTWRPAYKNYGNCEMLLPGVFYDGKSCGINSGCNWKEEKPPFKSRLLCKFACEL